jgi:hypothetical protein
MMTRRIRSTLASVLVLCLPVPASLATPFWGATASAPADTPLELLQPGEFIWEGGVEPAGPVVVVVSLPEQMAYTYRNGVRIGVSTVSSGKPGHGTPSGVFAIPTDRSGPMPTARSAARHPVIAVGA